MKKLDEYQREEIKDAIAGFVGFGSLFWIIFMISIIGG